jgi:hypothetical protein
MKDSEVRGLILRQLYDVRHASRRKLNIPEQLKLPSDVTPEVAGNVTDQLRQQGLVDFKRVSTSSRAEGLAQISARGVDVVEGTTAPPISISFEVYKLLDQSINVTNSPNSQVGKVNIQNSTGLILGARRSGNG